MPVSPVPSSLLSTPRRARLGAEFLLIFFGGPLFVLWLRHAGALFALLWIGATLAWLNTRHEPSSYHAPKHKLLAIFRRFALLAPLVVLAAGLLWPETFLSLPIQKPRLWLLVMVLYPVLSVWPQEMLYRRFLFSRYAPLFQSKMRLVVASATAFGFAHVIFLNAVAVAMTSIGGYLYSASPQTCPSPLWARSRQTAVNCFAEIFVIWLGSISGRTGETAYCQTTRTKKLLFKTIYGILPFYIKEL